MPTTDRGCDSSFPITLKENYIECRSIVQAWSVVVFSRQPISFWAVESTQQASQVTPAHKHSDNLLLLEDRQSLGDATWYAVPLHLACATSVSQHRMIAGKKVNKFVFVIVKLPSYTLTLPPTLCSLPPSKTHLPGPVLQVSCATQQSSVSG